MFQAGQLLPQLTGNLSRLWQLWPRRTIAPGGRAASPGPHGAEPAQTQTLWPSPGRPVLSTIALVLSAGMESQALNESDKFTSKGWLPGASKGSALGGWHAPGDPPL